MMKKRKALVRVYTEVSRTGTPAQWTVTPKPKLPVPEQEQEAAEGEVASTVTIKRHMLLDAGVPGDTDHQAPDVAE